MVSARNFNKAAAWLSGVQDESAAAKASLKITYLDEPFNFEGKECVALHAEWTRGLKHFTRMHTLPNDGTAEKIVYLINNKGGTADPIRKPGEEDARTFDTQKFNPEFAVNL